MTALRIAICLCMLYVAGVSAQTFAIVQPGADGGRDATGFEGRFRIALKSRFSVVDDDAAASAFNAFAFESPFNLTTANARSAASAIGCDVLLILRTDTQRRTSFESGDRFDASAVIYAVSGRTGRLLAWREISKSDPQEAKSVELLNAAADEAVIQLSDVVTQALARERGEAAPPELPQLPDVVDRKVLVPPAPYRRIKPEYSQAAANNQIAATVELTLDLAADGSITRTEITRWAGYGLDENVEAAVRAMNWRPAYRNGKPLAMRVLLRYNFTQIVQK